MKFWGGESKKSPGNGKSERAVLKGEAKYTFKRAVIWFPGKGLSNVQESHTASAQKKRTCLPVCGRADGPQANIHTSA